MQTRWYWKGDLPSNGAKALRRNDATPLSQVHAVQLIRKLGSGDEHYYCYEMNLVMKDASRVNVICHGNKLAIVEDAHRVGQFIGVPVWDASEAEGDAVRDRVKPSSADRVIPAIA